MQFKNRKSSLRTVILFVSLKSILCCYNERWIRSDEEEFHVILTTVHFLIVEQVERSKTPAGVCIQELNDEGQYVDVDVEVDASTPDVLTGGIHLLKQGLHRRVVSVDTVPDSDMLSLVCESITSISILKVVAR